MKKTFLLLTTLIFSLSLFSCMTIKEIPDDKTAVQILQMGQNAASSGAYSNAEFCFNTVIERFGEDPYTLVQAKYELGHIFSKQKKYDKAKILFNEILQLYNARPDVIPPKYKKLATMGLEKIEEEAAKKAAKHGKKAAAKTEAPVAE